MLKDILKEAGADETIERLRRALEGRTEAYEIFFSHEKGFSVEARERSVDALKVRTNTGVGLRTVSGKRQGLGFSSVLTAEALDGLVDKTVGGSVEAAEDKYLGFPGPSQCDGAPLDIFDESFGTVDEREKIDTALRIEESAMSHDPKIRRVRKASYSESLFSSRIVNSNGVDMLHTATYYSGSVTAVAEKDNESQMGWEMGTSHRMAGIDPEWIGRGAAAQAVRMLGARKIQTVKCPAVVENTVACELLEALAGSFLGDNVQKGKSMLIGKAGKKVASSALNVWDDGVMPGGWASSHFDGEGAPRSKTPLLVKGVCRGYLYDTYWAGRAGAKSTGSAARSNYKSFPAIGTSNLYIEKGEKGFDELLKEMGRGIFLTEFLGVHTINTVSGDFSLGAAGFWVEGGELMHPVRGMAVSGNLLGLFERVGACGADIRFIGSIGAPSLLINEIEASGT